MDHVHGPSYYSIYDSGVIVEYLTQISRALMTPQCKTNPLQFSHS